MSPLNTIIESTRQLQNHLWTAQEILAIPSEDLARQAYQSNASLHTQYISETLFLAHWSGLRQRYTLAAPMGELDESQLKKEWEGSPALRAEFNGSFPAYAAFLKADRQGGVRIAARRQSTKKEDQYMMTLTVSQQQYRESVAQSTVSTADRMKTLVAQDARLDGHRWTDDQLRAIPSELLRFAFEQSLALRTEFITFDTFTAYWRQLQRK